MSTGDVISPEARLRQRISGDLWERSTFHRRRMERAGLARRAVRHIDDLARLPPMIIRDVRSPSALMLTTPDRVAAAKSESRYWPLQWIGAAGLPLGYSGDDLDQLGRIGRASMTAAGVSRTDVVAALLPAGPSREWWQFSLGARRLGSSVVTLGPNQTPDAVDLMQPSVLLGTTRELARLLEAAPYEELTRVHTALSVDDADDDLRDRLSLLCQDRSIALVRSWAPEGTLALWSQCRGGDAFHSWPDAEIVEVVDPITGRPTPDGEAGVAVWTGTGWYASAVLRLWTGANVRRSTGACPTCGRTSPRFTRTKEDHGFSGVLAKQSEIKRWYAELQRHDGEDRLAIWVSLRDPMHSLSVLEVIAQRIGSAEVSVVSDEDVRQRIESANGEPFGDRRAFPTND